MIKIVNAEKIHIPEIIEIWKELMDLHRDIDPYFTRKDNGHQIFEEYARESIESQESQFLVAIDCENVVGYSLSNIAHYPPVFVHSKYGYISDIAVRREYQGQGVGTLQK